MTNDKKHEPTTTYHDPIPSSDSQDEDILISSVTWDDDIDTDFVVLEQFSVEFGAPADEVAVDVKYLPELIRVLQDIYDQRSVPGKEE